MATRCKAVSQHIIGLVELQGSVMDLSLNPPTARGHTKSWKLWGKMSSDIANSYTHTHNHTSVYQICNTFIWFNFKDGHISLFPSTLSVGLVELQGSVMDLSLNPPTARGHTKSWKLWGKMSSDIANSYTHTHNHTSVYQICNVENYEEICLGVFVSSLTKTK